MNRRAFLASAAALAAFPARAGTASTGGPAFGSYWRLTLPQAAPVPTARISRIIAEIDAAMSPYRASDLTRFNRARTTDLLPLPPETLDVARTALAIATETGGAFDPTVGPLVGRLGFGPIRGAEGRWTGLSAERDGLRKEAPGLTLDLCGIAKGHALDRIATLLDEAGEPFLLDLGGEVSGRGRHPDGRTWRVLIDGTGLVARIEDIAVATSGDAVQGYRLGSRSYGHIVDPARGAAATGLASVSVFHRSGRRADALATALVAMGRERAAEFAGRTGIEAVLVPDAGAPILTGGVDARLEGA